MKKIITTIFLTISLFAGNYIYVPCSGDKVIRIFKLDEKSGTLTLIDTTKTDRLAGQAVVSPDGQFLYVGRSEAKRKNPGLETYMIQANGKLKKMAFSATPFLAGFMTLDKHGKYLFSSSYRDGNVCMYKLENGLFKGKVASVQNTEKSAHSVILDHSNNFVFVPHTRPNNIYQFQLSNGTLKALEPNAANGPDTTKNYHAPRHIVKHPSKNIFYTSNESGGGISSWKLAANGQLKLWQTFSTLPDNADWRSMAADIKITANGQFAYVTNRYKGKELPLKDSIASFQIDNESGRILKRTGITPTMPIPSQIAFNKANNYLYLLSSKNMILSHYSINPKDGTLKKIKDYKPGLNPTSIVVVNK